MGVVDNEQWSAGEASAIAEVALPKLPVNILRFTRSDATASPSDGRTAL